MDSLLISNLVILLNIHFKILLLLSMRACTMCGCVSNSLIITIIDRHREWNLI
jgi:hypothetical protein